MKRGGKIPDAIQNAPDLQDGLELHFQAFTDLSSCRSHGMGTLSSIPWTAIDRYAQRYGITGDQFDRLQLFVRALDDHFLSVVHKKS